MSSDHKTLHHLFPPWHVCQFPNDLLKISLPGKEHAHGFLYTHLSLPNKKCAGTIQSLLPVFQSSRSCYASSHREYVRCRLPATYQDEHRKNCCQDIHGRTV